MTNKPKRYCNHPGWPPYNPMTGEKIPPGDIWECACGKNWSCPICGFGAGQWPCDCTNIEKVAEKYKHRFAGAWKELAK